MTSRIDNLHSAVTINSLTGLPFCDRLCRQPLDGEGPGADLADRLCGTVEVPGALSAAKVPGAFRQGAASPVGVENAAGAILVQQVKKWPGDLLWEFNAGAPIQAAPAVDDNGNLYFGTVGPGGKSGRLLAIDCEGNKLWEADAGERIVGSAPVITGEGLVVAGTMAGRVCAFDRVKGELAWDFMTGGEVRSSPVLSHDGRSIIIGSGDGTVYALDAGSGEKKWSFQTAHNGYGSIVGGVNEPPALGPDGTVFVGNGCGQFYALDGATGEKKWETDRESGRYEGAAAVGADGTVYVGGPLSGPGWISSGKSRMYALVALDGESGRRKWEYPTEGMVNVAPALGDDGTVYAGGDDSTLYAVDGATGRKKWEAPLEGRGTSSPCVRDGRVFVHAGEGGTENTIYAIDAQNGSVTWSYMPARISGHLFGGVGSACAPGKRGEIYTGNANGCIYAIQGSLPPGDAPESCRQEEEEVPSVDIGEDFIFIDGVKLKVAKYMNPGGEWLMHCRP